MRRANLFAYFLVLGLAACGGGGGGGSGSGGTSSTGGGTPTGSGGSTAGTGTTGGAPVRSAVPEQVALVFPATAPTTAATVSATTAARLMSNTMMGSRLAQVINSEQIALIGQNSSLSGGAAIQPIPCDTGSVTISTTNTAGTLAVDFVDCKLGFDTLNGPATLRIDAYDSVNKVITDSTLTFTRVHFSGANTGLDSDISGTQRTLVTSTAASWCSASSCATERMTQNITFLVREGATSRMARSRMTITNEYQSATAPTFFTQRLAGNVDDDQLGTVSVGTATMPFTGPWGDLYYSTRFQPYPDWGIVNINGAANSRARASSMGIALAKIEVDADGADGIYENNARLRWIDLATPRGANLNDTDGDHMHDSWEVAMGLNPTVPNVGDTDGDGFSDYTEYLGGADASTSGSAPAEVRHLWVTNLREIGYDNTTNPAAPVFNAFVGGSGDGVELDTVTREVGTPFTGRTLPASGSLTVTDAQGRTFTLAPTATPSTWTLSSSTGTSITIDNVGGSNPTSLIRYGERGIAFRTVGAASPGSNAFGGYIYLIESHTLIP